MADPVPVQQSADGQLGSFPREEYDQAPPVAPLCETCGHRESLHDDRHCARCFNMGYAHDDVEHPFKPATSQSVECDEVDDTAFLIERDNEAYDWKGAKVDVAEHFWHAALAWERGRAAEEPRA